MASLREEQQKLTAENPALVVSAVSERALGIRPDLVRPQTLLLLQDLLLEVQCHCLGPEAVAQLSARFQELEVSWIQMHLPQTEIEIARELAADVFGDEDLGKNWLLEPNMATDDKPPLSLLGTSGGLERVKNLLLRLQYGVLA